MTPTAADAVFAARVRAPDRPRPPTEPPELSVVVPLFDEQDTLPELHRRLAAAVAAFAAEIVYVNDGSRDGTAFLLGTLAVGDSRVVAVHLSRNFGHQAAVTAGLDIARGKAVVVLDGDLQDPPELIPALVSRWKSGAEVVYAVRATRREGWAKRLAYRAFYRLWRAASDLDVPLDAGDFCLMDRKAVDALNRLPERARFVRGLRAFVGFRQVGVSYDRDARHAGRPKYTLRKLVRLAADGLVGFSGFPVRAVGYAGVALTLLAGVAGTAVGIDAIRTGDVRGWAAAGAAVLFVGGLQLIATGVIGEYVRRVLVEVTGRPPYIVREVVRAADRTRDAA